MKSKMAYEILIEKETHTKFSICELPLNRQTSKSRRKKLMVETQPQTSVNKRVEANARETITGNSNYQSVLHARRIQKQRIITTMNAQQSRNLEKLSQRN